MSKFSFDNVFSEEAYSVLPKSVLNMRRRLGGRFVRKSFEQLSINIARLPIAKPRYYNIVVDKNVPYMRTGWLHHTLDIYWPSQRRAKMPVVIYVHGGAFAALSKDTHWLMGLQFANQGFVTIVPNYRLSPEHRFPAGLSDVCHALKWVKQHAEELQLDLEHVIFAGESAGANLITALTIGLAYDRDEPYIEIARKTGIFPSAICAAAGIFQVSDGARFGREQKLSWFFEDRYREVGDRYLPIVDGKLTTHPLIDVVCTLENETPKQTLPPFFLPVGGKDHLYRDHERMDAALKKYGVKTWMKIYPNEVHAFHAFIWRAAARACWSDHWAFLREHGVHASQAYGEYPRQHAERDPMKNSNNMTATAEITHSQTGTVSEPDLNVSLKSEVIA